MAAPQLSWGRAHRFDHAVQYATPCLDKNIGQMAQLGENGRVIPFGQGRSYGDVGLNNDGTLLKTDRLDKVLLFDRDKGIFRAQAGITLEAILHCIVPHGWFLPVTPGTKQVSLGGAVANDVHGKNHHQAGSFGAHITRLSVSTSDGLTVECSPGQETELFNMTIGGIGLTGFINWVEFKLTPIKSAYVEVENIPYNNLEEFFDLSSASQSWPYTVAWVDCFARGHQLGRGIFSRAKFSEYGGLDVHKSTPRLNLPVPMPSLLLNRLSISVFNRLYRHRSGARYCGRQHYDTFFYPLDGISNWNRLYGKRGFFQHQCLIPMSHSQIAMKDILTLTSKAGQGSFLAVMKLHGKELSPGVMSFGQIGKGVSLAMDFANKGERTLRLLDDLDDVVRQHGGRLYCAKDGRMNSEFFKSSYPEWHRLETLRDPAFESSFWRRVMGRGCQVSHNNIEMKP